MGIALGEMMQTPATEVHSQTFAASWMLWENSFEHAMPLARSIDHALSDYVFFPEPEWAKFGYRPPDNLPLLGAWRDSAGTAFAFLLDRSPASPSAGERRLLLYASGARSVVEEIGSKVTALKSVLAKSERKEIQVRHAEHRIELEEKSPAVARLLKLVGLFTIVVNAFSLYLRRLPLPNLPSGPIQETYQFLVAVVHFAALFLLLTITLIGIGYVLRYGVLMLKRF
ncbi:MAG: hypothetical protein M0P19_12030 [Nevskia sp.]|nr:hypothetical protein [Nevskia sp.]